MLQSVRAVKFLRADSTSCQRTFQLLPTMPHTPWMIHSVRAVKFLRAVFTSCRCTFQLLPTMPHTPVDTPIRSDRQIPPGRLHLLSTHIPTAPDNAVRTVDASIRSGRHTLRTISTPALRSQEMRNTAQYNIQSYRSSWTATASISTSAPIGNAATS